MISFELHMRTLQAFLAEFNVTNCCIAAHDWGGQVHLCGRVYTEQKVANAE